MANEFHEYMDLVTGGRGSGPLPDGRNMTREENGDIIVQTKPDETVRARLNDDGGLTINRDRSNLSESTCYDARGAKTWDQSLSVDHHGNPVSQLTEYDGDKTTVRKEQNPSLDGVPMSLSLDGSSQSFRSGSNGPDKVDIKVYEGGQQTLHTGWTSPAPDSINTSSPAQGFARSINPAFPDSSTAGNPAASNGLKAKPLAP